MRGEVASMREVEAGEVLRAFYRAREKRGIRTPTIFRKRLWGHAETFLAWCKKEGIGDPIAFLEWRWGLADEGNYLLEIHRLRSKKLAHAWLEQGGEGRQAEVARMVDVERRTGSIAKQAIQELRILTVGNEAAKYQYPDRRRLCMAEMDYTGGYHPESRYCPTCPLAVECSAQLYARHGFDVVSLRAGRLHALPQEIAAAVAQ